MVPFGRRVWLIEANLWWFWDTTFLGISLWKSWGRDRLGFLSGTGHTSHTGSGALVLTLPHSVRSRWVKMSSGSGSNDRSGLWSQLPIALTHPRMTSVNTLRKPGSCMAFFQIETPRLAIMWKGTAWSQETDWQGEWSWASTQSPVRLGRNLRHADFRKGTVQSSSKEGWSHP